MTTAVDGKSFSNISATTAGFYLKGGYYVAACVATFSAGSVDLQALGPDGSTWLALPVPAHFTVAAIIAPGYLPPGQYRFLVTTATAVFCNVTGVPIS